MNLRDATRPKRYIEPKKQNQNRTRNDNSRERERERDKMMYVVVVFGASKASARGTLGLLYGSDSQSQLRQSSEKTK